MATFDEVRDRLRPATKTVAIPTDYDLAEEYALAKAEAQSARDDYTKRPDSDELKAAIDEAEERETEAREALDPHLIHFLFRAMGKTDFDDLVALHPPTPDQRKESRKKNRGFEPRWNSGTFRVALIAACCADPEMSEEQVKDLLTGDFVNEAQSDALFMTALQVNQFSGVVDLGKGSRSTRF